MSNLLPPQHEKALKKEYNRRRIIVALSLCIAIFCLVSAGLVPSFILLLYRSQEATAQLSAGEKNSIPADANLALEAEQLRQALVALQPQGPHPLFSDVVAILNKHKGVKNKIREIHFLTIDEGVAVTVHGLATTRQGLRDFIDLLEEELAVDNVVIPVSNFTRDSNIQFSFTFDVIK